jgi:hypothetical protein
MQCFDLTNRLTGNLNEALDISYRMTGKQFMFKI